MEVAEKTSLAPTRLLVRMVSRVYQFLIRAQARYEI